MIATTRKPYGGMQMEGPLASWYAHVTSGDARHARTAQTIAERLPGGGDVLEVAPGPGYMAVELARLGRYRIAGLDISHSLVRIANENARRAGVDVDFRHGDVAHMPFPAESFDFVVCQAAFKNFSDPVAALDEIHRVLRPGARASIFDLRKDAPRDAIDQEVRNMHLAPPSALLTKWIFRFGLLRAAFTRAALEAVVARSRFGHGDIVQDGIGFELRLTKQGQALPLSGAQTVVGDDLSGCFGRGEAGGV
jgi:ubiquinone/menaquinone biosynthesis C-methylase UbiE